VNFNVKCPARAASSPDPASVCKNGDQCFLPLFIYIVYLSAALTRSIMATLKITNYRCCDGAVTVHCIEFSNPEANTCTLCIYIYIVASYKIIINLLACWKLADSDRSWSVTFSNLYKPLLAPRQLQEPKMRGPFRLGCGRRRVTGNMLDNRRRWELSDNAKEVMTSLVLCWRSTAEKIVYIFLQDLYKRKHCLSRRPADFSYRGIDNFAFDAWWPVSFDKILPK
jgi:hypothetical protein